MCGVFGIFGDDRAASLTQLGLYSLQHRGQESWGMVSVSPEGVARATRAMGLISEASTRQVPLDARLAIGHTRYSTAGSSTIENAQPILARSRDGHIAIGHNGNLTNATELRSELENEGSIFSSTIDSEVIVHRVAKAPDGAPEVRLAAALAPVEGACALDIVNATAIREVAPGEIIAVDASGIRSIFPFERKASTRCVFEYVYFARPDSRVFGGSVDRARRALGRQLAREVPAPNADLVFAVPDSSNSAALGFAEESHLPYELALIRNHYVGRTFIQPEQAGRDAKVKVKYNAVREVLEGKRVVMVDDSIVRGTTTRGLVAMVRAAGAIEVHMRVSSPP